MDILSILKDQQESLILEDLDYFETELGTNSEYNEAYKKECYVLIKECRKWLINSELESICSELEQDDMNSSNEDLVEIEKKKIEIVPQLFRLQKSFSTIELVKNDIETIRQSNDYKREFKEYIYTSSIIDEEFIEKHFSIFRDWEIDAIVSVKPLSEPFLEKYFGAISPKTISRYQMFSESFFMKHYSQLDPKIVLTRGKNEWRKKEKRSKQLDVFLRLKGVKD